MTTLEKLEELIYTGFKDTDRKFQETDRKFQETDRKFQETDREISTVGRQVRDITDSLGRFAENMVAPAIVKLFNRKGIPITDYAQRVRSPKRRIEYDIVAFNDSYVVVVSVKMTLRVEHVQHFLNERLPIFKEVFPRYKDMKVIGAVAGANIVQDSDIYAIKRGLYVLAQSGDNITVLNDENFEPKIF
jgi:signal peptidase I